MKLEQAERHYLQISQAIRFRLNHHCDVAGGVFKGKSEVHDLDIVIKDSLGNVDKNRLVEQVMLVVDDLPPGFKVEFYITDRHNYDRLLAALRSSRWEVIHGRLMQGLTYRKIVIGR